MVGPLKNQGEDCSSIGGGKLKVCWMVVYFGVREWLLETMVTVGLCRSVPEQIEVIPVSAATSTVTIEKLRAIFATHGLPERIVTDNGTVFTSEEFEKFLHQNGIAHTQTAPYHPASNGLVEHAVQTFKQGIKRLHEGTVQLRLTCLVEVQTHTATTMGRSPTELLLGRQPRSQLDLLHPDVSGRVQGSLARQQRAHDRHTRARAFQVGDRPSV